MSDLSPKSAPYRTLTGSQLPCPHVLVLALANNLGGWLWSDVDFLTIGEINGWRQNDLVTFFDT
jgi:hypothetical protein